MGSNTTFWELEIGVDSTSGAGFSETDEEKRREESDVFSFLSRSTGGSTARALGEKLGLTLSSELSLRKEERPWVSGE